MNILEHKSLPSAIVFSSAIVLIAGILVTNNIPDSQDILRYYESSNWLAGGGTLYKEVFSEYPLAANLIFAFVRWISIYTKTGLVGFGIFWISLNALLVTYLILRAFKVISGTGVMAPRLITLYTWLSPAVILFGLLRYDVYPAIASLIMMASLKDEKYLKASLWLGTAIALKGYALFFLPSFFIYLAHKSDYRLAIYSSIVAIIPFSASLAIVYLFSGFEGLSRPFYFHALREFNPDSSYQAINYLLGLKVSASQIPLIPQCLQIIVALTCLLLKPKTFEDMVDILVYVVVGFAAFSVFYSPQFILWFLPVACFSSSKKIFSYLFLYSIFTSCYYIVANYPTRAGLILLILSLTMVRFAMMYASISNLVTRRNVALN